MLHVLGERQQLLLQTLHKHKHGLTVDELAKHLVVTRTAVKQHLESLERSGFIERGRLKLVTKGRPGRIYSLTPRGIDLFPKQYSWFSGLLLSALKADQGSNKLAESLRGIASSIATSLKPRIEDTSGNARLSAIANIMNELSYDAAIEKNSSGGLSHLVAHNCVYHHLAQEHPEVCEFDIALLKTLSGGLVSHQECIIRGGNVCRFAFKNVAGGIR